MRTHDPFHRSKMMVGLVGASMILGAWRWAVFHLYTLPEAALPAFQSITNQCFWGVILIAGTIAGVKGLEKMMSLKTEALSTATSVAQSIHERREEKIETIEHVIEEGSPGAPDRRPFSPDDSHEGEL